MTKEELISLTALSRAALPTLEAEAARINALHAIADALKKNEDKILTANARDVAAAREKDVREAMIDRLSLTKEKLAAINPAYRAVIDVDRTYVR